MARKARLIAVTPMIDIPERFRAPLTAVFGITNVKCQICGQDCIVDPEVKATDQDVYYCIDCSTKAGLSKEEVLVQLVKGLSLSYIRFAQLMEIFGTSPGSPMYSALLQKLKESGVIISGEPESES